MATTAPTTTPMTATDLDNLLSAVTSDKNYNHDGINTAMDTWRKLGSYLVSRMQGTDGYESASGASDEWGLSLAALMKQHLSGWQGDAADEFAKQVNIIARFGNEVGLTMCDPSKENTNRYYSSNTYHLALSDIQDALGFVIGQHNWTNKTFNDWATAVANGIMQYNTRWAGNTSPGDGLPTDWAYTSVQPQTGSFQGSSAGLNVLPPVIIPVPMPHSVSTTGTMIFTISVFMNNNDTTPFESYPLAVPAVHEAGITDSWRWDNYYVDGANSGDLVKAIKQNVDKLYTLRLQNLKDFLDQSYDQIGQQLPVKQDESGLPKGGSPGDGGPQGGGPFGGFGGGSGTGLGGGFGGGGGPGGGSGGGGSGGGFGGSGGGVPVPFGGGSGGAPTQLAGLGGGGLPGGLGGGGLPGGLGGLAGGGSPGGLAGGGGLGPGGAAGAAANEAAAAARGEVPLMPPMMPPMMNQNQDGSRQRKSWLPEDEDLWGGAADAVPPVISSDG